MTKKETGKYITEHFFELRHDASGRFLDLRGKIADHIKKNNICQHWSIQENTISFFDEENIANKLKAIVSFNKITVISRDPPTHNYFQDQSLAFWKAINEIKEYDIPEINRFGARTKCYIPANKFEFKDMYNNICQKLFDNKVLKKIGGSTTDLQLVLDFKDNEFNGRIILGPVKKNEAGRYFSFISKEFNYAGLYIDIDIYKIKKTSKKELKKTLDKAMLLTWKKIDDIALSLDV